MFLEQVTVLEISSKENEITEIYQPTDLSVMLYNRTFNFTAFCLIISYNGCEVTPNHLHGLWRGDRHGYPLWWIESQCFQSIIRIHPGVNEKVYHDVPSGKLSV